MAKSWKQKYNTYEEEIFEAETGITAFAGGGQGSATALIKKWNEINTCVTDDDSVKLPISKIGMKCLVFNNTDQELSIFPVVGEKINTIVNMEFKIGARQPMMFECIKTGIWMSYGIPL